MWSCSSSREEGAVRFHTQQCVVGRWQRGVPDVCKASLTYACCVLTAAARSFLLCRVCLATLPRLLWALMALCGCCHEVDGYGQKRRLMQESTSPTQIPSRRMWSHSCTPTQVCWHAALAYAKTIEELALHGGVCCLLPACSFTRAVTACENVQPACSRPPCLTLCPVLCPARHACCCCRQDPASVGCRPVLHATHADGRSHQHDLDH